MRIQVGERRLILTGNDPAGDEVHLSMMIDHGGRYRVIAPDATTVTGLLELLEGWPGVSVLASNGGLLGAMTVAENLSLALRYGADPREDRVSDWEPPLRLAFELCGLSEERVHRIGRERPMRLDRVERLMIGLVRNLLRPPELLVLDRVFAGLSRRQAEAVLALEALYHDYHPFRPSLFVDIDSHELPSVPDCSNQVKFGPSADQTPNNSRPDNPRLARANAHVHTDRTG